MLQSKTPKRLRVIRFSNHDFAWVDYWQNKRIEKLRAHLNNRSMTVKDLGDLGYRTINHWDEMGLLPDGAERKGDGWRKFTRLELVWLHVLGRLRDFGVPLEMALEAKKTILHWEKKNERYPLFEFYVVRALGTKDDVYAAIFPDGSGDIATLSEIAASGSKSMVLISIKEILRNVGFKKTPTAEHLFLLSDAEIELIASVRLENNSEIKVGITDNQIKEIESTFVDTNPAPNHELQSKIVQEKMYGRMTVEFEDGKRRAVKITERKRFQKK